MEFLIRDRLSWLRFLGFDRGAATPDANTIRLFRERLTRVGAMDTLFAAFDRQLRERGYLPMGGQIVDATLVAAPKQRNTKAGKEAIKAGRTAAEIWPDEPARAAQKDTDARWTVKFANAQPRSMAACSGTWPRPTTPRPMSGLILPIAARPTRLGYSGMAASAASIARSHAGGPCPSARRGAMRRSPASGPVSSMFSPGRRSICASSSIPSVLPVPRSR